jgi:glycosyltransferase involved in cell wall biosynthesis
MIVAVIPALNEESTITEIVRQAAMLADLVVVVDDGSTDDTYHRACSAGADVIRHDSNRGVGTALASGLSRAVAAGADAVFQMDGDGQHVADDAQLLLELLAAGADLVVGTRFESGFAMGRARRLVIGLLGVAISRRIGIRITDPTSGFRGFSARAAELLATRFPTTYLSDTVEVLYIAHELGLRIDTVPVRMRQRQGGTSSVGLAKGVMYTARVFGIVAAHSLRRPTRHVEAE